MIIREYAGWTGAHTRETAEGAIANETRIQKIAKESGDTHAIGAEGTVLGSLVFPEFGLGYFVEWNDSPKVATFVAGWKITPLTTPMHTKDVLAERLRAAGLDAMATKAAEGYYHDYLSPLAMPAMQLHEDLMVAATACADTDRAKTIRGLVLAARHGDFDASKEEADAWAATPEGQEMTAFMRRNLP